MMSDNLTTLDQDDVRWYTTDEAAVRLLEGLPGYDRDCSNGRCRIEVVKENRNRVVSRVVPCKGGANYFLKYERSPTPRVAVKRIFRTKSGREFESYRLLARLEIPCARPVAWGKQGVNGVLLTEELTGIESVGDSWERCRSNPDLLRPWMGALIKLVAQTISCNVYHPDLQWNNVLYLPDEGRFAYVDVYGVVVRSFLTRKQKFEMASSLAGLLSKCPVAWRARLLADLAEVLGSASGDLYIKLCRTRASRADMYRRKRRKKFMGPSSIVRKVTSARGVWRIAGDFDLEIARAAVDLHVELVKTPEKLIKNEPSRRRLSRAGVGEQTVIVKEFVRPGGWLWFAPDYRSWLAAWGLRSYDIPTCRCCAWLKANDGTSYMILDDLGPKSLHRQLVDGTSAERAKLLKKAGELIGRLHNLGIYHRDLKDDNFVLNRDTMQMQLVDLDAVTFRYPMIERARERNFQQFFSVAPKDLTNWELAYLFCGYRRETRISKERLRELRCIADQTET